MPIKSVGCDIGGCNCVAEWFPTLVVTPIYKENRGRPIEFELSDFYVCAGHKKILAAKDFITDGVWELIYQALIHGGKPSPARISTTIVYEQLQADCEAVIH